MSKQTKIISSAWEAEEIILKLMAEQSKIRTARDDAKLKAENAVRDVQYQFYMCKATILDNRFIEIGKTIELITEFLPLPDDDRC
ncbi:hypothetical protein ACFSR6_03440 [Pedobacter vanadiisoli]|uniref:Uncharacterized protein n=1 Tax=Pedobacter vanadiisoli TaxID=1761975 RepID=A0ABW5MH29_9SPHI